MPKAYYNKVAYIVRIFALKNSLLLLPLLFIIIACSVGNGHLTDNISKPDNSNVANPINRDQNPPVPPAKCTLNNSPAQIAFGCNVESNNPDNLGYQLSKSVVGIAIPLAIDSWHVGCTGTIIGSKWVLTAAHCLAKSSGDFRGRFRINIQSLLVVPWQLAYNGVPTSFNRESADIIRFPVKAIYIPYHYAYFNESYAPPYTDYIKDDFALLELESTVPDNYQPIAIESAPPNLPVNFQLWSAGYGDNESQIFDGQLHYRDIYYFSKHYNISLYAWPSLFQPGPVPDSDDDGVAYGMIYTLGSPVDVESKLPSAWSFLGPGDSGGPVLYYNQNTQKFSILATHTGGSSYNDTGYYAPLPDSLDENTEVTEARYTLIRQIINKTASKEDVRCISRDNICYPKMVYVLNQGGNSISVYGMDQNENLQFRQSVDTGANPRAFAFDNSYSYISVLSGANSQTGSTISIFKINYDGTISLIGPKHSFQSSLSSIIASPRYNDYFYAAGPMQNTNSSSILRLKLNHDTGSLSLDISKEFSGININKLKPLYYDAAYPVVFDVLDTSGNKIIGMDRDLNRLYSVESNMLNQPTDELSYFEGSYYNLLVLNSGDNSIVMFNGESVSTHGEQSDQILSYTNQTNTYFYVRNIESNNIAIFEKTFTEPPYKWKLGFKYTIPTGGMPTDMAILNSLSPKLFEVNGSNNTIWQYSITQLGDLVYERFKSTGIKPIAVITN